MKDVPPTANEEFSLYRLPSARPGGAGTAVTGGDLSAPGSLPAPGRDDCDAQVTSKSSPLTHVCHRWEGGEVEPATAQPMTA